MVEFSNGATEQNIAVVVQCSVQFSYGPTKAAFKRATQYEKMGRRLVCHEQTYGYAMDNYLFLGRVECPYFSSHHLTITL